MGLRFTTADYEAHMRRFNGEPAAKPARAPAGKGPVSDAKQRRVDRAVGGRGMNRWEREYQERLRRLAGAGEVAWFAYEPVKIRLADRTYYSPDFLVLFADGRLEAHEVKGFMRDDAAVKLKCAAELFPAAAFVLVTKRDGEWQFKAVRAA